MIWSLHNAVAVYTLYVVTFVLSVSLALLNALFLDIYDLVVALVMASTIE